LVVRAAKGARSARKAALPAVLLAVLPAESVVELKASWVALLVGATMVKALESVRLGAMAAKAVRLAASALVVAVQVLMAAEQTGHAVPAALKGVSREEPALEPLSAQRLVQPRDPFRLGEPVPMVPRQRQGRHHAASYLAQTREARAVCLLPRPPQQVRAERVVRAPFPGRKGCMNCGAGRYRRRAHGRVA